MPSSSAQVDELSHHDIRRPTTTTTVPPVPPHAALPARPTAEVASRNNRRAGLAWILRQLGADEKMLDNLADGNISAVMANLTEAAGRGDAAAINVLGELAYQHCYLARDDQVLSHYEASQLREAQALPAQDGLWLSSALRSDIAFDKEFNAACAAHINQDQVQGWVAAEAATGDGASLWLLARDSVPKDRIQRFREAAAAGFPQAQFELAWAILGGQEGAAGGPGAPTAGDLLRQSAAALPRSEGQLAVCEFSGCSGVAQDIPSSVIHARDAAEKGSIDAMLSIGPLLPASQIDPNEVEAWRLVKASVEESGCGDGDFSVRWMRKTEMLTSSEARPTERAMADSYWSDYGSQIMMNLGCTG